MREKTLEDIFSGYGSTEWIDWTGLIGTNNNMLCHPEFKLSLRTFNKASDKVLNSRGYHH